MVPVPPPPLVPPPLEPPVLPQFGMLPGNAGEQRLHLGDSDCLFVTLGLEPVLASVPTRTNAATNILSRITSPFSTFDKYTKAL